MSNIIVISGGLAGAITAGGVGSNGASFPIKYFLLAYDAAIDPDVHGTGVTSASAFSATAAYGDASLIQRGGHYIFKKTDDYTISTEKFLILKGGEAQGSSSISGSDKAHSTAITLYQGSPLLNCISGTSESDLFPIAPAGSWHSSQLLVDANLAVTASYNALLASSSNYFPIESYTPILANSGTTSGSLRGVYKCRVNSEYGNFKFNKIGIYLDSGSVPVLIGVACLNNTITKTKTGDSITNLEFDIEIQFTTQGTFEPVVYMTEDYWIKVPVTSGYGLYTDKDIAIGSSGVGWLPQAKLTVTSQGDGRPVLALNRLYNQQYMFFDFSNNITQLSATSSLRLYTDSNTLDGVCSSDGSGYNRKFEIVLNDYDNYSGTLYKYGIHQLYKQQSDTLNGEKIAILHGVVSDIVSPNGIVDVMAIKGSITYQIGAASRNSYGGYFLNNSTNTTMANCNKYGVYSLVTGRGKLYGVWSEVRPSSSDTNPSYAIVANAVGGTQASYGIMSTSTPDSTSLDTAYGIYANSVGASGSSYGVYALANTRIGTLVAYGVYGSAQSSSYAKPSAIYGGYFEASGNNSSKTTDVLGGYFRAVTLPLYGYYAKRMFGVYAEVIMSTTGYDTSFNEAYGGYFKAPVLTNSYAISADGKSYLNGAVTIGSTLIVSGNISTTGFTSFGITSGHLGLKCKVLDFTSDEATSGTMTIYHYLDSSKIVSINAVIYNGGGCWLPYSNTDADPISPTFNDGRYYYSIGVGSSYCVIINGPSNTELLGKPGVITIWYKE